MMFKKILLACTIMMIACNKGNDFVPVYNVPIEFKSYVQSFIAEGALRGHAIIINNLIIQYDTSLSAQYCAISNVSSSENNMQKIVSINANIKCWQNNTQLETLIFHELGHCILGRAHDNSLLPNGDPKSIMYPDNIAIYSPCVYNIGGDSCNKLYRRTYYIDELFDAATPTPDWAK